ncbi:MAG TPA: cell division protein ZapA [Desulfobacteria bacterium]|nr:cell division protein ZapA [Desulfobacteria bacterium]
MKNPIRIRILDNEYLLRSDEDPEQVSEIAKLVNDKLDLVRQNSEKLSEGKTAILAAFDIAGDYLRLLKERDILLQDVQDRCRLMNRQIESLD